jgi:endonuclease/exonuclease/phosphatase family metal-dependent hydrolase
MLAWLSMQASAGPMPAAGLRSFKMGKAVLFSLLLLPATAASAPAQDPPGYPLRIATFNVQDVRTADLQTADQPRLRRLAEVIQRLRPDAILLNEIAYDAPGASDVPAGDAPGQNGQRFADFYLARPQAADLQALRYRAFMAPVNSGQPSGMDLDRNGRTVLSFPPPPPAGPDGLPPEPTADGREYGGDCWGFGTFPGQYGMALLISDALEIERDKARTFRLLPWDYMPGAELPPGPDGEGSWLTDEQKRAFRLSSKSVWDIPVRLPNRAVIHFLCSHPTPPVFDGPGRRNARRNHDEIRLLADYIRGSEYLVDDRGSPGGLDPGASFIILGDLNADPSKGSRWRNPIADVLFTSRRVNPRITPAADVDTPGLDPTDTAAFKLRVDYVLPSTDLGIAAAGVWRQLPEGSDRFPSDHFPVWMDVVILAPPGR